MEHGTSAQPFSLEEPDGTCSEGVPGTQEGNTAPKTKVQPPWWNDEVKQAIDKKRKALRLSNRTGRASDYVNYKRANAHVRFVVRNAKAEYEDFLNEKYSSARVESDSSNGLVKSENASSKGEDNKEATGLNSQEALGTDGEGNRVVGDTNEAAGDTNEAAGDTNEAAGNTNEAAGDSKDTE